ncbi:hypothetical protein GCM10022215_29740 [Nocardioides fonticola]|uniref:Uncharacterized protein n=1 Tax=Nocardioides fonticola TaxID=450363 RepID=A0ABP7XPB6_9ACTN
MTENTTESIPAITEPFVRVLDLDTGHQITIPSSSLPHGRFEVLDEPALDAYGEPAAPIHHVGGSPAEDDDQQGDEQDDEHGDAVGPSLPGPPAKSAPKAAWVEWAVIYRDLDTETAEAMTRDELAALV